MDRYVWLYPEKHEANHGRHIHLTTARLSGGREDPNLPQLAHVFEEFDVEVPDKMIALDEKGMPVITGRHPNGSPIYKEIPSEHPNGLSYAHHMQAACGLTRSSWVHPIPATDAHPRCPLCAEKVKA